MGNYLLLLIPLVFFNAEEVTAAVPIDIATEIPGHTYKPIMMFIPDKKPLISRRQRGRYDRDYYDYRYGPDRDRRRPPYYDDRYPYGPYGPDKDRRRPPYYDDRYPYGPYGPYDKDRRPPPYHDKKNWRRVKVHDSFYEDDISLPFLMADTWRKVPSVGHGEAIASAQVLPIFMRMLTAGFFRNEVMDAVKRWQYDRRYDNRWKWRYRRKLIQSGKIKDYRGYPWGRKGEDEKVSEEKPQAT